MIILIAGAMPARTQLSLLPVNSVSVLDLLLLVAAAILFLDCAFRPLDLGYAHLFMLLCVPLVVCAVSMLWSHDRTSTLQSTVQYAEGLIAYLFILRELRGASPNAVMTYIKRFTYLLIVPAVLLLLHVPGFGPEEQGLPHDSSRYLSYYTRLSHPVLGPSNNLATVLAFFVPVLLYWGQAKRDRRFTRAGFVGLVAVVCTLSRGVMLALLVVALLAAVGSLPNRRGISPRTVGKAILGVAAVVAGIALLYKLNPDTHKFFGSRLSLVNIDARTGLADAALRAIADHPLLGFGGGAARDFGLNLTQVHNTYLQQMLNYGLLLGLVVSLSLIGTAVFFSRRRNCSVAPAIGLALVGQLLIFAVESSFEGSELRVLFYLSVGLVTALARACEVAEAPDSLAGEGDTRSRRPWSAQAGA